MLVNEDDLPSDPDALRALTLDLARRLRNAQLGLAAARQEQARSAAQAAYFQSRLAHMSAAFRRESIVARVNAQKAQSQAETKRYDDNKKLVAELHEKLRLKELDHKMTGNRQYVPEALIRLRQRTSRLENEVTTQRTLLAQLSDSEAVQESLLLAVQQGTVMDVMDCLQRGADIHFLDAAGFQPIHYACKSGNLEIVHMLLSSGADPSGYLSGHVPLTVAVTHGHIALLPLLLDFGARINERGISRIPVVIEALRRRRIEAMCLLLDRGANIHAYDAAEESLLHHATRLTLPPDDSLNTSKSKVVSKNGKTLKNSTNVNVFESVIDGEAFGEGIARDVITLLLQRGADPTRLNRKGLTPLMLAQSEGNRAAVAILQEIYNDPTVLAPSAQPLHRQSIVSQLSEPVPENPIGSSNNPEESGLQRRRYTDAGLSITSSVTFDH